MSGAAAWKEWIVGGALIETDAGLLLVQNQRRGGRVDWSPPGGVIDEGEELLAGLTREVVEETGLLVTEWHGPTYEIEAHAPGLGWHLRVEVWTAVAFEGSLHCDDPDGIVTDVRYVPADELADLVRDNHPWVVDPLREYLAERWVGSRSFAYHVEGERLGNLVVTRR
ncbi:MAG: NUDIX hydrolase [Actinobacteria bacterium]|nr:NUDIX hydrolase [Actinomycetota bacterium]